jgi:choline dehydrogenase
MFFKTAFLFCLACVAGAVPNHYHHDRLHWHARRQTNSTVEYDYIVVGSGAGGGPLASRLAIAGYKVLIIEAGDDQGDSVEQMVPAMQLQSTEYTPMKWDYFVQHYDDLTRQEKDSKMVYQNPNGSYYVGLSPPASAEPLGILYPRSGTLGGCTAHNAMVTIYPFESDWTYLQTLTGNDSWAPDHMRTYFEKLERCRYLPNSVVGHGFDGWLTTFLTPLTLVLEDLKVISLVLSAASAMGKVGLGEVLSVSSAC